MRISFSRSLTVSAFALTGLVGLGSAAGPASAARIQRLSAHHRIVLPQSPSLSPSGFQGLRVRPKQMLVTGINTTTTVPTRIFGSGAGSHHTALHWSKWNRREAITAGEAQVGGGFPLAVRVKLTRARSFHGHFVFTRLTWVPRASGNAIADKIFFTEPLGDDPTFSWIPVSP